jgi:oligo-1,6-glucosidase
MPSRILFASLCISFFISCKLMPKDKEASAPKKEENSQYAGITNRAWWKEAVVYQVYPRSFKDSDGDGVGDLKGIIAKLDYIKSLGVDVIWLNPVYASPNDDNGYDISDYQAIMKEFGTMEDFDALLKGMHDRGLKLVMDLVVNHSSSEHNWFKQSRSSRTSPYRNYYHWWPAERGKPSPRFSFFDVNGNAWKYDSLTNAYYLHIFSEKQPDLNWENPALRQEIYKMMRFWLDKGIDGFRMDAFQYVSKDTSWPVFPQGYEKNIIQYYNGPHLHDYIQEMHREVLSKYNIMTVAEGAGASVTDAIKFVDPARKELNMAYHFEGMDMGYLPGQFKVPDPKGLHLPDFKSVYTRWDTTMAKHGWTSVYLANHDQPRMVTRWGNDAPPYREASSKMLTTFLLTMRGTPYYYYGDELGMSNIKFEKIEDYRDIETLNRYQQTKNRGGDLRAFIEAQKISARDNGRTPMQWDGSANAGFSAGTPWLRVNPNYTTLNAAAQEKDSNSVLNYFRKMIRFRKDNPVLIYGDYEVVEMNHPKVYAYVRTLGTERLLVMLNFTKEQFVFLAPDTIKFREAELLMSNNATNQVGHDRSFMMMPYYAAVYRLKH